jgi:Tfp pilus assembly pilus retraction ATPase PilT
LFAELDFVRIILPCAVSYSSKEQVSDISLFKNSVCIYRFIVEQNEYFELLGFFNDEYESVSCVCLAHQYRHLVQFVHEVEVSYSLPTINRFENTVKNNRQRTYNVTLTSVRDTTDPVESNNYYTF